MGSVKKILIAFINDGENGGVDKYIMNFYKTLNQSIHFDFLTNKKNSILECQLAKHNSRLIEISTLKNPFKQFREISDIFQQGNYDVFYLNASTAINYIVMKAAYAQNIPLRICHSHSSGIDCNSRINRFIKSAIHKCGRYKIEKYANRYLACSTAAAQWMYTDKIFLSQKYILVHNAFDVESYIYSEQQRNSIRRMLKIGHQKVIGFIGTLCYPKNIPFTLEIFSEIVKQLPDARLMVVGDGPMAAYAKQRAEVLQIADNVMFLGRRKDIKELLQAMDLLLAPSIFEGLSFVSLEAQAAGLKCFLSRNITEEAAITPYCRFLDLSASAKEWAQTIVNEIDYDRIDTYKYFEKSGYVISKAKNAYMDLLDRREHDDDFI